MSSRDEVYPNSPLVEVVFELRFPGELSVECRRHEYWERIRDDYPKIWVPTVVPGKISPLALEPYRFEREDRKAGVMVALNRLAYFTREYQGHKAFQAEFMRLHRVFGEIFRIERVNRAGWRYINIIPFAREDGLIPLDQFLTIGFRLPRQVPERFKKLSLVLVSKLDGGTVTTRLETLASSDGQQEALLLDFDYGKEDNLQFEEVEAYLHEAHDYTRNLFEDLITDNYRRYLRGEVLS